MDTLYANPMKDESQSLFYNCQSTSQANVWNGYFGNKIAKHFMGYTVGRGTNYETTYTSTGGYDSNFNYWQMDASFYIEDNLLH